MAYPDLCFSSIRSHLPVEYIHMKIELNEQERQALDDILTQKDENCAVSELYNSYLDDHFDAIGEKDVHFLMDKEGLDEKTAMEEAFLDYLNLDSSDPVVEEMKEHTGFGSLTRLDEEVFLREPFQSLKIPKAVLGPYQLRYNYFSPFELFTREDTTADEKNNFAEMTSVGYFDKKVPYLMLTQGEEIWMSITPHEINTMKKPIAQAFGDVLTFGLGLGYFAYEISNKDDVNSVTIIEKDAKVIELFKKNILPLFTHKEKIRIIKIDAFLYFDREMKDTHYDYVFVDIYHTSQDALPLYLRFLRLEKKNRYENIHYWIEDSILCLMRRYVLTLIEEYFLSVDPKEYDNIIDEETDILSCLYHALEDKEFHSIDEVKSLLSNQGLKSLAKETKPSRR